MDWLTFLHLWVYPLVLGVVITATVWAGSKDRIWLFVLGTWAVAGLTFLSVIAHLNYQGYLGY